MTEPLERAGQLGLAVAVLALSFVYAGIRTQSLGWQPAADPGIVLEDETLRLVAVRPLGAADRAGLKPHDRLLAIDDRPVETALEVHDAVRRAAPGDTLRLTVNLAGLNRPRTYAVVLDARRAAHGSAWVAVAGRALIRSLPLLLLAGATALLVARRDRIEAWLVALVTAGAIAAAPLMTFLERIPPGARAFSVAFKVLLAAAGPALLHHLLSIFPERSALDRHDPRIKSVALLASIGLAAPFAVWASISGGSGFQRSAWPGVGTGLGALGWIVALGLGAWSLGECARFTRSSAARHRARILGAGGIAALVPAAFLGLVAAPRDQAIGDLPVSIQVAAVLALLPLPLAVGYTVLATEVLPLRAAMRRAARWVVAGRGAIVPLAAIAGVAGLALADLVSGWIRTGAVVGVPVGAACAAALVWEGAKVHRSAVEGLERRLFAAEWKARRAVERLTDDFPEAASTAEVLESLEARIRDAFRPSFLAVYLASDAGSLKVERGTVAPGRQEIPLGTALPASRAGTIGSLHDVTRVGPDYLVPILGLDPGLLGLLVLGERDADGPYSAQELERLEALGTRVGVALERLRSAAAAG